MKHITLYTHSLKSSYNTKKAKAEQKSASIIAFLLIISIIGLRIAELLK